MTEHRYFVSGRGEFPSDMLRYDQATVVKEITIKGFHGFILKSARAPTIGRWVSFLWTVWPMRMQYPAGDPENGPAEWHVRIGPTWIPINEYRGD